METFLISIACTAVVGLAALVFQQPTLYDKLHPWLAGLSLLVAMLMSALNVGVSVGSAAVLRKWPSGDALQLQMDGKVPPSIGDFRTIASESVDLVQGPVWIALLVAVGFTIYLVVLSFLSIMVKQHKTDEERKKVRGD